MTQQLSKQGEMDVAARSASDEFESLDQEARNTIRAWWEKWYGRAGHRRLGRSLIDIYPNRRSEPNDRQMEMDEAARLATDELESLDQEARNTIEIWWKKWYSEAGHVRLGRVLLGTYPYVAS